MSRYDTRRAPGRHVHLRRLLPRTAAIILLGGLLLTLIVKLHRVIRTDPADPLVAFGDVALTDVAVFLGAYALIRCCHVGRGGRLLPSLSILPALLLALWSVLDSA